MAAWLSDLERPGQSVQVPDVIDLPAPLIECKLQRERERRRAFWFSALIRQDGGSRRCPFPVDTRAHDFKPAKSGPYRTREPRQTPTPESSKNAGRCIVEDAGRVLKLNRLPPK